MGDDCLDHLLQCPAAVREPDTPCPRHTGELLIGQVRQQADRGLACAHPIQNLRRSGGRLGTLVAMGVPTTISRRPSARAIPGGLQEPAQEVIALGHVYSERADGVSGTVVGTRLAQIRPAQTGDHVGHLVELPARRRHQFNASFAHNTEFTRHCVYGRSHAVSISGEMYHRLMPRLWNETIESHRREVRDAILDATAALVTERGLLSVTMSQIAEKTGIGRATLYKYFPDVETLLFAWHERQITAHLGYLVEARDRAGTADQQLEAVLEAFALITHESHGHRDTELAALLHRGEHVVRAQQQLTEFISDLLTEGARHGEIRDDIASDELARYCLHALTAAAGLPSVAAIQRLVQVTLDGLRLGR